MASYTWFPGIITTTGRWRIWGGRSGGEAKGGSSEVRGVGALGRGMVYVAGKRSGKYSMEKILQLMGIVSQDGGSGSKKKGKKDKRGQSG